MAHSSSGWEVQIEQLHLVSASYCSYSWQKAEGEQTFVKRPQGDRESKRVYKGEFAFIITCSEVTYPVS